MSQYPPGARRSAARERRRRVCLRDYWPVSAQVLVVEDDQATAEMIGIVLKSQSLLPQWVGHGTDAVAAAAQLRPRLVLLDLVLPDLDGVTVCRKIREVSSAPVVIVSASRDPDLIDAAMAAGADDYLPKPFTVRQLMSCVDTHVPASVPPSLIAISDASADATPIPVVKHLRTGAVS
ncbi:response regulator [Nocardia bovistercoris]|uniref:Response regulator n=1 Tax=Nocardia bovistercoris TaxID=2785916 RepID=A0A931IE42_9NOCA|nr:response regulator [Nocardia bovistercoris]MBH0778083.1 response regulator [Nocardia bovistercoris]